MSFAVSKGEAMAGESDGGLGGGDVPCKLTGEWVRGVREEDLILLITRINRQRTMADWSSVAQRRLEEKP